MRITILSLLIIGIVCGCSKMKHQTTTVKFKVEDVTGVNQMKPFQVALIEESIPLDLRQGPSRTIVELFEPEPDQTISFETELSKRDKHDYYIQFIPLDGFYDSGLIYKGFSYPENMKCEIEKQEVNSCILQVEPVYKMEIVAVNLDSEPGDSILLKVSDPMISVPLTYSGFGSSAVVSTWMPYGHQTLSYQVYEDGALILDHEESFFAPHNLDTLIEVSF